VDGVELAVDVEHADGFAVDFNALAASGLDLSCLANLYEIPHSYLPFIPAREKFRLIYEVEGRIQEQGCAGATKGRAVTAAPIARPSRRTASAVPGDQKSLW